MLTNTYECLAIILRSLRLVANCIRKPIRLIFATFWRICREYIFLHSQGYSPQCESSITIETGIKLLEAPSIAWHLMASLKQTTIVQSAPQAAVFGRQRHGTKMAQYVIAVKKSVVSLSQAYTHWFTPSIFENHTFYSIRTRTRKVCIANIVKIKPWMTFHVTSPVSAMPNHHLRLTRKRLLSFIIYRELLVITTKVSIKRRIWIIRYTKSCFTNTIYWLDFVHIER